jgi:hypothetical protein
VYWECNSRLLSEDGEYDEDYTVGSKSKRDFVRRLPLASYTGNPNWEWHELITEFSKLKLTFETDRLPAVAALAQRMRTFRRNDIYVAGMWKNSILANLCWHSTNPDSHTRLVRPAPTWSWATIPGNIVNWAWSKNTRPIPTVKLLDLSFTSVGPANVGEAIGASLTVKAHVILANLTEEFPMAGTQRSMGGTIARSVSTRLPGGLYSSYGPWSTRVDLDHNNPLPTPNPVIKVLILKKSHESVAISLFDIILRQLPGTAAVYERIGWITFDYSSYVDSMQDLIQVKDLETGIIACSGRKESVFL